MLVSNRQAALDATAEEFACRGKAERIFIGTCEKII
jgi:hypothetical protein